MWGNLIDAAKNGDLEKMTALVEKGNAVDGRTKEGRTPLIQATVHGHVDVVKFLIGRGADINAEDNEGETALSWAVIEGHTDVVTALVDAGADKEVRGKLGFTPLMVAVIKRRVEIMRILLAAGADPLANSRYGTTMEQCVEGNPELLEVLASATTKQREADGKLPEFETVSTPSSEVALSVLFEKALPATPLQTEPSIRAEHDDLKRSWGSPNLCTGDECDIRRVVDRNLCRIAEEPGFRVFDLSVDKQNRSAQVNAIFRDTFVPVRLWRTTNKVFACGNSLFG